MSKSNAKDSFACDIMLNLGGEAEEQMKAFRDLTLY